MERPPDKDVLPVGAISKSWWARSATVLFVSVVGLVVGFFVGHVGLGLLVGVVGGVGCVVMGESSMDTGSYKHPVSIEEASTTTGKTHPANVPASVS